MSDGQVLWSTPLGGIRGDGFVTLNADGRYVYAFAKGQIYCLDINTGAIIWTNELNGFGYGIGSICILGFGTAPDAAAYAKYKSNQDAQQSAAT